MKRLGILLGFILMSFSLSAQSSVRETSGQMVESLERDFLRIIESIRNRVGRQPEYLPDKESADHFFEADAKPVGWPTPTHRKISSGFGYRLDPFSRKRSFHTGIDLPMPVNTPVFSTGPGVVIKTGRNAISGLYIIIRHGDDYESIYAHLNKIIVSEGQKVDSSTLIALSGNTGRSTGPHLHYGITRMGTAIDPLQIISHH